MYWNWNNNQAICVCQMKKFSPRCYLPEIIHEKHRNFTCEKDDQHIPQQSYLILGENFLCLSQRFQW